MAEVNFVVSVNCGAVEGMVGAAVMVTVCTWTGSVAGEAVEHAGYRVVRRRPRGVAGS
jgi:hypothetical protein